MRLTAKFILPLFLVFISLLYAGTLLGLLYQIPEVRLKIEECLLPSDHPLQDNLKTIFQNKSMFKSPGHLAREGFEVNPKVHRGMMVAGHPSMGNYLIKKFENSVPQEHQLANFLSRINGARALKDFIDSNHLQHIAVPQKWLYPLPELFSDAETGERSYVLVVEKMNIRSGGRDPKGDVARKYKNMDQAVLRELCTVLYFFRGLDSELRNLPFTYENQIALIDTEKWDRERNGYLRRIKSFLTKENREYASQVLRDLQHQEGLNNERT